MIFQYEKYSLPLGGHNEFKISYDGVVPLSFEGYLMKYRDYSFEELIARLGFLLWEDDIGCYRASLVAEIFQRFFQNDFIEKLKTINKYRLPLNSLNHNWEDLEKDYRLIKHIPIELPPIKIEGVEVLKTPRGFWWNNIYYNLDVCRFRYGGDEFIVEPYTERKTNNITVLLGGLDVQENL